MRTRASTLTMVLGLLVSAVGVVVALPQAEPAAADHCEGHTGDGGGTGVGAGCGQDGGDPTTTTTSGGGNTGGRNRDFDPAALCAAQAPGWGDCVAVVSASGLEPNDICGYVVHPDQSLITYYYPDVTNPEEHVLLYNICIPDGLYYSEDTQLGTIGQIVVPPTPEEVADDLWAEVSAQLQDPAVEAWPAEGTFVTRTVPTFVYVTNWQGTITESDCDAGVCVELTAEPSLTYDPREEDSQPVACEDGGTRYVSGQGTPREQANHSGSCTYPYAHRTINTDGGRVPGRPAAWTAVVAIDWEVTWEGEGEEGEIEVDPLTTDLERIVGEVNTVIVSGG
jgi:hypothetical protein